MFGFKPKKLLLRLGSNVRFRRYDWFKRLEIVAVFVFNRRKLSVSPGSLVQNCRCVRFQTKKTAFMLKFKSMKLTLFPGLLVGIDLYDRDYQPVNLAICLGISNIQKQNQIVSSFLMFLITALGNTWQDQYSKAIKKFIPILFRSISRWF